MALSSGVNWLALAPFIAMVLKAFRLDDSLAAFVEALVARRIAIGAIDFTIGAVITFFVALAAVLVLSGILRFSLSAGLYGRIAVQRGTGEAVSKLLHYLLVTVGSLEALGAAGIDLNRFMVLAGALGIGVGFGLHTIASNFISGLILLFERPLHVGDKVTVGDTSGEVKDIGIRASRILTWDGADVLIPNASLVTGNFTN